MCFSWSLLLYFITFNFGWEQRCWTSISWLAICNGWLSKKNQLCTEALCRYTLTSTLSDHHLKHPLLQGGHYHYHTEGQMSSEIPSIQHADVGLIHHSIVISAFLHKIHGDICRVWGVLVLSYTRSLPSVFPLLRHFETQAATVLPLSTPNEDWHQRRHSTTHPVRS